jgi:cation diffusion facilitator CzcD-associated flavoprotein CzcO
MQGASMSDSTRHNSNAASQVLDVLVVGAGFGGVCAGIKLLEAGIDKFVIYEQASGIGGTWFHNTYPGAACDIPSHLYCYSFAPNPDWTRKWSGQAEILEYIGDCAERFRVTRHIQLNMGVARLRFCNEQGYWLATLDTGEVVAARHVISAVGGLHMPLYPQIAGMQTFSGPSMHSARWDHTVDFAGKRVAVVGSAASAIHLIPELAKIAGRLDVYQRTPNYIAPRGDFTYSEKARARFRRWPLWGKLYRTFLFYRLEWLIYPLVKHKHPGRWHHRVEKMIIRPYSRIDQRPNAARVDDAQLRNGLQAHAQFG